MRGHPKDKDDDKTQVCYGGHEHAFCESAYNWQSESIKELQYWEEGMERKPGGSLMFDDHEWGYCEGQMDGAQPDPYAYDERQAPV